VVDVRGDVGEVKVQNLSFLEIDELKLVRPRWQVVGQVEELLWSVGVWSIDVSIVCLLGTTVETDGVQAMAVGGGAVQGDGVAVKHDSGFPVRR
jgi:hypothetical protein